ncbi:Peptidyl-prolyl cis-trans isomerase SurA [Hartmannibacter diazotrophicus]|uniref:Peptidyl-prolyl cis-trans isomerase SurA n=1 Tax=Hartmannibacter diazotrophicus TaxID=1482074 RepID=A0A2C9D883_9HYPH|nr:SurA N-terminal domain-containing protein [Hartmannibacter diazotrophicus]SON55961.1 Peptidyl-prolyl cis-trans isomerase SurA [Hartmannibacter diazotrophicus]
MTYDLPADPALLNRPNGGQTGSIERSSAVRSPMRKTIVAAACLLAMAFAASPEPSFAAGGIKVIVNDTAITDYDIAQRTRLYVISQKLSQGAAQKAAMDELIDEALHLQTAKRMGISVPDAEVDSAIATIAGRSNLTTAQFSKAVAQAGLNISTLRDRIKGQLIWGRIVRGQLQRKIKSEKSDFIAQLNASEKNGTSGTADDYILQRVIFTLKKGASKGEIAQRTQEAQQLRARFRSCDAGLETARSIREVAVLNIGRRLAGELPEDVAQRVRDTPVGQLTAPQVTSTGIELYAVCGKEQVSGQAAAAATSFDADALNAQGQEISDKLTRELRQSANIVYR